MVVADLLEVHPQHAAVRLRRFWVEALNQNQPVRITVRQWPEQHAVREAEDRDVDAETERDGEDRDDSEAGIASQETQCKA
jgi:hypothetical protein